MPPRVSNVATTLITTVPSQAGAPPLPVTDQEILPGYLSDASRLQGHADALFRPASDAEVALVCREASQRGIPLTIVARQTATTGSAVPMGGWILSMEHLQQVLWIDPETRRARAQGGVLLGEFQKQCQALDLMYTPDPTSRHECSLGASVACNASGARSFKYGPTRPWVTGLRVVLASGEMLELRRGEVLAREGVLEIQHPDGSRSTLHTPTYTLPAVKHSAGYHPGSDLDLIDLFIGSEGTLGVITEVEVKLLPVPEKVFSLLAFFPSEEAALVGVEQAREGASGVSPRCIEWLDGPALDMVRGRMPELGIPTEALAGIFVEQECTKDNEEGLLEGWLELLGEVGALLEHPTGVLVADTPGRQEEFRRARHAVPAGANEKAASNRMPKVGTDLSVPREHLRTMMDRYHQAGRDPRGSLGPAARQQLLRTLGLGPILETRGEDAAWQAGDFPKEIESLTFGHVGDCHLHVNFLPTSARGLALARAVYGELTREAIRLGGSPSGEHGIGKIKRESLEWLFGAKGIAEMVAIKKALDPAGILGRGNLFAEEKLGLHPS